VTAKSERPHVQNGTTELSAEPWRSRFDAIAACTLQAQIVHRRFVPLWVNVQFVDLFGYESLAEALAEQNLERLFSPSARADSLALERPFSSVHGRFGNRTLRRATGAAFRAEIYARRASWDGGAAVAIAIRELGEEAPHQAAAPLVLATARGVERRRLCSALHGAAIRLAICDDGQILDSAPRAAAAIVDLDQPAAAAAIGAIRAVADLPVIALAASRRPWPPEQLDALGVDALVEKSELDRRLPDVVALLTRGAQVSVETAERGYVEDEHHGNEPADHQNRDHP